jgi:hypothetical protein
MNTGAAADCLTDEALSHLKTYKYSAVDLSPVSHYVLRHYVCTFGAWVEPQEKRGRS